MWKKTFTIQINLKTLQKWVFRLFVCSAILTLGVFLGFRSQVVNASSGVSAIVCKNPEYRLNYQKISEEILRLIVNLIVAVVGALAPIIIFYRLMERKIKAEVRKLEMEAKILEKKDLG